MNSTTMSNVELIVGFLLAMIAYGVLCFGAGIGWVERKQVSVVNLSDMAIRVEVNGVDVTIDRGDCWRER